MVLIIKQSEINEAIQEACCDFDTTWKQRFLEFCILWNDLIKEADDIIGNSAFDSNS